jgi:alkylation response protein AidB-like acyl-CoA dehydrogenase
MDIKFTEEQEIIRSSAREFLASRFPKSLAREIVSREGNFPKELWVEMAALGWMGLALPEKYGGSSGKFLDLVILLEEMGRACIQSPFFNSAVLAPYILLEAGTELQKQQILTEIGCGNLIVSPAIVEPEADFDPSGITVTATLVDGRYAINGTKLFVPYADVADYLIIAARTKKTKKTDDVITLFLVGGKTKGIKKTMLKTVSCDRQFELELNNVMVPCENVIGELNQGWKYMSKVLLKTAVAKCAEMNGGAQQVLDMTVSYAKERVQFGRPIGSFQAVQHHCVNMLVDVEVCRWSTYKAAWMIDEGMVYQQQAAITRALCNQSYGRVVALGHQVIGGVAYCLDHDMPLYFRHARSTEIELGDAEFYKKLVEDGIYA